MKNSKGLLFQPPVFNASFLWVISFQKGIEWHWPTYAWGPVSSLHARVPWRIRKEGQWRRRRRQREKMTLTRTKETNNEKKKSLGHTRIFLHGAKWVTREKERNGPSTRKWKAFYGDMITEQAHGKVKRNPLKSGSHIHSLHSFNNGICIPGK